MFRKEYYFYLFNFDLNFFTNNSTIIVIYIDNLLIVDINKKFINIIRRILVNLFKIIELDLV